VHTALAAASGRIAALVALESGEVAHAGA
jgi:hypothetical protein